MKNPKKIQIIATLSLVTLSAFLLYFYTHRESGLAIKRNVHSSLTAVGAATPKGLFEWQPGVFNSYEFTANIIISPPDFNFSPSSSNGVAITGCLHLRVDAVQNDTVTLSAGITDVVTTKDGVVSPEFNHLLNSEFARARIQLTRDGRVLNRAYHPQLAESDREILNAIYGYEFVARLGTYTTPETPKYIAKYTWTEKNVLQKTRSLVAKDENQELLSSSYVGEVSSRIWLKRLQGEESTLAYFNQKALLRGTVRIALYELQTLPEPKAIDLALAKGAALTAMTTTPGRETRPSITNSLGRSARKKALMEVSIIERIRELDRRSTEPLEKLTAQIQALRDFVDLFPDSSHEVMRVLQEGRLSPATSGLLVHALASSQQPEPVAALAHLIADEGDISDTVVLQASVAAGAASNADDRVQAALWKSISSENRTDKSETAFLVAGALAETHDDIKSRLAPLIEARLQPGTDASEMIVKNAILAAANARLDSETVGNQVMRLFTESPAESVRVAASDYFGRMPEGSAILLERLGRETSATVALAIVDNLASANGGEFKPHDEQILVSIAARASTPVVVQDRIIGTLARSSSPKTKG